MNALFPSPSVSVFSGNVEPLSRPRFRYQVTERTAPWVERVVERLNVLCGLPRGWDGYQGEPVSFAAANFTLDVLNNIMWDDAPTPSLVPCGAGDLQIEWHLLSGDLELHVRGPHDVSAYYVQTEDDGDIQEAEIETDFTVVAEWLREMGEKRRALLTSAA